MTSLPAIVRRWHYLMDNIKQIGFELGSPNFALALNVGKLNVDSYELTDGIVIRKAQPKEIAALKLILSLEAEYSDVLTCYRNPYETTLSSVESPPGSGNRRFVPKELPPDQWRYHVVTFSGSNSVICDVEDSTIVALTRLLFGPVLLLSPQFGTMGSRGYDFFMNDLSDSDEPFLTLGTDELDDVRQTFVSVQAYQNKRVDLADAMNRFRQLDAIPKSSALRMLGYVSILESIITHQPDPADPYRSLTRQVRQKMILLGHRCKIPLRYDLFDASTPPETIWSKLYEYRSKIAHGTKADFSDKLRVLKSPEVALRFVTHATISVMRQVLEEPELLADLRDC